MENNFFDNYNLNFKKFLPKIKKKFTHIKNPKYDPACKNQENFVHKGLFYVK